MCVRAWLLCLGGGAALFAIWAYSGALAEGGADDPDREVNATILAAWLVVLIGAVAARWARRGGAGRAAAALSGLLAVGVSYAVTLAILLAISQLG